MTPYAIWISEVMLQQTQVKVVIPYFLKWMTLFPNIEALALAKEEEVLKAWEGLGYYSRARHLHRGAQYIVEKFHGVFPSDLESVREVPGIGPYTAGAILSFAFKKRAAAVDANVARVLCRYFALEEKGEMKSLSALVLKALPKKNPHLMMEGLIEIGALVCQKTPKCPLCPLKETCKGFLQNNPKKYPVKPQKKEIQQLQRQVLIILSPLQKVLLFKETKALMKGLWHFPYVEISSPYSLEIWKDNFLPLPGKENPLLLSTLPSIKHQFTRYVSILYPTVWRVEEEFSCLNHEWVDIAELEKRAFPSGHRALKDWLVENRVIFYSTPQISINLG